MNFSADFHVHSRFSRATSQNLDLENLYIAAQLKGITVVGTGDFTHPQWFSEISEKLVPAEEGLFRLKDDISAVCDKEVPRSCRSSVRFVLTAEISNIYKKENKTRKNHNLVVVSDFGTAARFSERLAAIGNIHSDGRPILGVDAKTLLEILLETSENSHLIPAHIWTPWFSVMGSKSGFDSIEECFEDLSKYIFAVETGLSSDPAMNRRVSGLDKYTLISNSDAHSPMNLGREANIFNTELSYPKIFLAIKNRSEASFLGTYEFYPEEGKYHLDGHRKCNVRFSPKESIRNGGICPQCEKPLTLGVLYRVEELADRPIKAKPEKHPPYYNSIPLTDILAEIFKAGPKTKTVQAHYHALLNEFGSEYSILHGLSTETFKRSGIPLLEEAIFRVRKGELHIDPGYDGEFGKIQIFKPGEREKYIGQKTLFAAHSAASTGEPSPQARFGGTGNAIAVSLAAGKEPDPNKNKGDVRQTAPMIRTEIFNAPLPNAGNETMARSELNPQQLQAIQVHDKAVLIAAGPGTGKTLTLTRRIAHLITTRNVLPENILAVTFTNKAAQEMRERITVLNSAFGNLPLITTFHALCYKILCELNRSPEDGSAPDSPHTIIDETEQVFFFNTAVELFERQAGRHAANPAATLERIRACKQRLMEPADLVDPAACAGDRGPDAETLCALYGLYQQLLAQQRLYDFEDLIIKAVKRLDSDAAARKTYQDRFKFIFVDEFQDINAGQHRLLQLLSHPANHICVIGDPDQSIYAFRGSDPKYFSGFVSDFTDARVIELTQNYRSTRTIVDAAQQVIAGHRAGFERDTPGISAGGTGEHCRRNYSEREGVPTLTVIETASEKAEAVAVGKLIESMIGGTGFHFMDFDAKEPELAEKERAFSDFAVLYRTGIQAKIFAEVFGAAGIPHQLVHRDSLYAGKGISGILSLLRIFAGAGSFLDMERLKDAVSPGVSPRILKQFRIGSFENKMNLTESLKNVRRLPIPGMSKNGQKELIRFLVHLDQLRQATAHMTVAETVRHVVEKTRLAAEVQQNESTSPAFRALMAHSEHFSRRLPDFIATLTLQTDTDMYLPRSERVALMTMHAAKGLEFPVVFVCGCENGYIPLQRSGHTQTDPAEERRLFYVAMTRAKERLFLTYARQRRIYGKKEKREASPFIDHIDSRLKELQAPFNPKKKTRRQLELF